jgi:hypothetical protein
MNPAATLLPDISFDDGPGITCWHTDCYRFADAAWQVVWSQATAIRSLG